jgi:hypothetical protein
VLDLRKIIGSVAAAITIGVAGCVPSWAQDDGEQPQAGSEPAAAPATAPSPAFPWPAQFSADGRAFVLYPPELDRWEGDRLQGRVAVSVRGAQDAKPVYGAADITAHVRVESGSQRAQVSDLQVTRIDFPTAPNEAGRYREVIQKQLATIDWQPSVDQLRGEVAVDRAARSTRAQPVRNDPPRIAFSDQPAILVPVDGAPVLRDLPGLGLKRVINTRALILQDPESDRFFLDAAGRWFEARRLEGPWTESHVRPSALDEAKQQLQSSGQVDTLERDGGAAGASKIIVSTTPTELVQTDGAPQYTPVAGTQLLYVTNTPNRLFLDLRTQQYYVLLSGRWYRTQALDAGRWEYVPGNALPADFAAIPENHPTATVRESVPGTPQAAEAVIANSVPQVASVKRTQARLDLTYDGPPQFQPIEGTPLTYAVNAAIPVISVNPTEFYALDNGVWFYSANVDGPWSPASTVPPVIYTIPRSSPLYYVTYVRVYDSTPSTVYVGYAPGYVGSYVSPDNTVVYGSGYYYQPWVGSVWYGYPVTWGFGFSYWNSWWNPWPWRPWWAYHYVPYYRPWWGPWHRAHWVSRPVAVAPAPIRPAPAAAGIGARSVVVTGPSNGVTHIYQRWGRAAAPSPATSVPITRAAAIPPGSPPAGQGIYRQHDGQWQRFQGNGEWANVAPPAGRGTARSVPVLPAPIVGAPPSVTTPRAGEMPQPVRPDGSGQRSIVGPAPGISTPAPITGEVQRGTARSVPVVPAPSVGPPPSVTTPRPGVAADNLPRPIVGPPPGVPAQQPQTGGAVRVPPGSTSQPIVGSPPVAQPQPMPRPSVGPAPGMANPDFTGSAEGRRDPGDRGGHSNVITVPPHPSTPQGGPPVRQRTEPRPGPARPVPVVPAPGSRSEFSAPRGGFVSGGRAGAPAVMVAPSGRGRGGWGERGGFAGGRGGEGGHGGGGHGFSR